MQMRQPDDRFQASGISIHREYRSTVNCMRTWRVAVFLFLLNSVARSQPTVPAEFDIASVKPSSHPVGPDYNNLFVFSRAGITARNATLRRLIAEAYGIQMNQVLGPNWLDQNEFDIDARAGHPISNEERDLMLRLLLTRRFHLRQHQETRDMHVYELIADATGLKIHAAKEDDPPVTGPGFHFRGDMRHFADLLTVQLSIPASDDPTQLSRAGGPRIPVIDKTGLPGIYEFSAAISPEPGVDSFTLWKRALPQMGLKLESRKGPAEVLVVDSADRVPVAN